MCIYLYNFVVWFVGCSAVIFYFRFGFGGQYFVLVSYCYRFHAKSNVYLSSLIYLVIVYASTIYAFRLATKYTVSPLNIYIYLVYV